MSNEDGTTTYKTHMSHLVTYWTGVRNAMCNTVEEDVVDSEELRHGFWPHTQQQGDFLTDLMQDGRTREEVISEDLYIGILEGRPPRAYNVAVDLYAGYYVFVRPAVDSVEPVWLGRAVENPQFDPSTEHFREVLVQWYIPCGTSRDLQRLYTGCSTNANFRWKVD